MSVEAYLNMGYMGCLMVSCVLHILFARSGRQLKSYEYTPDAGVIELVFLLIPVWNLFWFGSKYFFYKSDDRDKTDD